MTTISAVCQAWGSSAHLTQAAQQEENVLTSKSRVLTGFFQTLQVAALFSHASKLEEKLEISFARSFRCFLTTLPFLTAAIDAGLTSQSAPELKKRVQWLHTHIGFLCQIGSLATSLSLLYLGCRAHAMTALAQLTMAHLIKKEAFPSLLCNGYQVFSYLMMFVSDVIYGTTLFRVLAWIDVVRLCLSVMLMQDEPKQDQAIG